MQANSDGLSPSLRPFLGVGWNRALPAPFGFGNGIAPDGVNDYLIIPGLIGKTWPMEGCIEFWCNVQSARGQREIEIQFEDGSNLRITAYSTSCPAIQSVARAAGSAVPNGIYSYGTNYHYCFMWDNTKLYAWGNGVLPNTLSNINTTSSMNLQITGASICAQVDGTLCSNSKINELRFYNRKLSIDELTLNDNNGVGNNPSTVENLIVWYDFEIFEPLDFSALQDNSDLKLGIRDKSGRNNHAQPINMITDSGNPNYVLKPF